MLHYLLTYHNEGRIEYMTLVAPTKEDIDYLVKCIVEDQDSELFIDLEQIDAKQAVEIELDNLEYLGRRNTFMMYSNELTMV